MLSIGLIPVSHLCILLFVLSFIMYLLYTSYALLYCLWKTEISGQVKQPIMIGFSVFLEFYLLFLELYSFGSTFTHTVHFSKQSRLSAQHSGKHKLGKMSALTTSMFSELKQEKKKKE